MKYRMLWCWLWDPSMRKFFPENLFDVTVPGTERGEGPSTEDELLRLILDMDFLVVRRYYQITRRIIENGKRLKLIQRAGARYDNIDVEAAREAGIPVACMPMSLDASVAELVILLMLALSKRLIRCHWSVVQGEYRKLGLEPTETSEYKSITNWMKLPVSGLFEKTLGIVGLGEIGELVSRKARGFQMKVIYTDIRRIDEEKEKELGVEYRDFRSLLKEADFVTLHAPLGGQTRRMIGRNELSSMKRSSFLINTSRGGVIDDDALYQALKNNEIAGAGLDVFEKEPVPADHPLLKLDNVVFTPHIGGMGDLKHDLGSIRDNINRVIEGKSPINMV